VGERESGRGGGRDGDRWFKMAHTVVCEEGGARVSWHHMVGGGSGAQCRARLSEGMGSALAPATVGPSGGGRRSGRQGRARGGGGPVWRVGQPGKRKRELAR
jgi:hypothetical protein